MDKLPDELFQLVLSELKKIHVDPFNRKRSHELRGLRKGYISWYPESESKLKDFRIIYRVEKKAEYIELVTIH